MNNSEGTGIFDALLPQDSTEQPENSAVESEVEVETNDVVEESVETDTETESVEDESNEDSDDSEAEELVYEIEGEQITLKELKELKESGLRQADYTKKSQANAEEKKALDAEKAQISETRALLEGKINEIDKLLVQDESIDMDYLRDNDPSEYLKQKELAESRQKAAELAKKELNELKETEFNNKVASEQQKLLEAVPELANPETQAETMQMINDYMTSEGFTEDDTKDLVNHKVYKAFFKAAQHDKLVSKSVKTEKQVKSAPKVVKASPKTNKKAGKGGISSPYQGLSSALYS